MMKRIVTLGAIGLMIGFAGQPVLAQAQRGQQAPPAATAATKAPYALIRQSASYFSGATSVIAPSVAVPAL